MNRALRALVLTMTVSAVAVTTFADPSPAYADVQQDAGAVVKPDAGPQPGPVIGDGGPVKDDVVGLIGAIKAGRWLLAVGFIISLLTAAGKLLLPKLKDDRLGAIAVFVVGFLGVFSASLIAGVPIGLNVILGAISATFTAVGGYSWVKKVLWPDRSTS